MHKAFNKSNALFLINKVKSQPSRVKNFQIVLFFVDIFYRNIIFIVKQTLFIAG